ncbi:hypothetical protein C8R44DRAFT_800256, partial [Mycena epipterygia]
MFSCLALRSFLFTQALLVLKAARELYCLPIVQSRSQSTIIHGTMNPVLQLQEVCDHIMEHLYESPTALKACSLVCFIWTSSSQRLLFRDIIFHRRVVDIYTLSTTAEVDEAAACRRFCTVLKASPRLLSFVRRLRTSLQEEMVTQLSTVKFPNLQEIVLHRGGVTDESSSMAVAKIISLPSIRRVGLVFPFFRTVYDFARLFQHSTPRLESLFLHEIGFMSFLQDRTPPAPPRPIKQLHLSSYTTSKWIHDPLCPFDFSTLEYVECKRGFLNDADAVILDLSRSTLTRLNINPRVYHANHDFSKPRSASLARFAALTHLQISASCHDLTDIESLVRSLPPSNCLENLVLDIMYFERLDPQKRLSNLRNLGTALAGVSLPALRRIEIVLLSKPEALDSVTRNQVRATFGEFVAKGRVDVVLQ